MADIQRWARVRVVGPDRSELALVVLEGKGGPDLLAVDRVARLVLLARRLGGRTVVLEASPALRSLLELAGLRVEVEGQAELGEETVWVQEGQEEGHRGDLAL